MTLLGTLHDLCLHTDMEERLNLVVDREVVNSQETGGKSANMQSAKKVSLACHFGQAVTS